MNNRERDKFIETLRKYCYDELKIVSVSSGMQVGSICYVEVIGADEEEENQDRIYLVVDSASSESVHIDYKAIRYVKENINNNIDSIEIGV